MIGSKPPSDDEFKQVLAETIEGIADETLMRYGLPGGAHGLGWRSVVRTHGWAMAMTAGGLARFLAGSKRVCCDGLTYLHPSCAVVRRAHPHPPAC